MQRKLVRGERWARFLGDRLRVGEEPTARALWERVVRRSADWRSALVGAEVEARLAWRWAEELGPKEEELRGVVDGWREDVQELSEVVAEAAEVRGANQRHWVAAAAGACRAVAGGGRKSGGD
eukprot:SAG11_NODE_503_length_8890_cov_30.658628_6_plen_123_part_00